MYDLDMLKYMRTWERGIQKPKPLSVILPPDMTDVSKIGTKSASVTNKLTTLSPRDMIAARDNAKTEIREKWMPKNPKVW